MQADAPAKFFGHAAPNSGLHESGPYTGVARRPIEGLHQRPHIPRCRFEVVDVHEWFAGLFRQSTLVADSLDLHKTLQAARSANGDETDSQKLQLRRFSRPIPMEVSGQQVMRA